MRSLESFSVYANEEKNITDQQKLLSFIYEWGRGGCNAPIQWAPAFCATAYSYANSDRKKRKFIWKAEINVGARMSSYEMNVLAVNCELSRGKSSRMQKK